jgi:hypothetical protein
MDKQRSNDVRLAPERPGRKKVYRAPRLQEYGDLRKITMAKGSNRNDAPTPPSTKK